MSLTDMVKRNFCCPRFFTRRVSVKTRMGSRGREAVGDYLVLSTSFFETLRLSCDFIAAIASRIWLYVPHLQISPLTASVSSLSVGLGFRLRSSCVVRTKAGVQNPHWYKTRTGSLRAR